MVISIFVIGGSLASAQQQECRDPTPQAPSSPIRLDYEAPARAELGQSSLVQLTVSSALEMTSVEGQVYAGEGLIVSPEYFSIAQLDPATAVERSFTVTPFLEGPLRFSVLVQGATGGQIQAGHLTVPVQVGGTGLQPTHPGTLQTDSAGDSIVSLPGATP